MQGTYLSGKTVTYKQAVLDLDGADHVLWVLHHALVHHLVHVHLHKLLLIKRLLLLHHLLLLVVHLLASVVVTRATLPAHSLLTLKWQIGL